MTEVLDMIEEAINMAWAQGFGEVLPNGKFFIPNEKFWNTLQLVVEENQIKMLIDCGAGEGHVAREARERGFKMAACDIYKRECHVGVEVQNIPAHRMPFDKQIWPIVCRPDRGGWCSALWQRALGKGSGFIYCGKEEAMPHDVSKMSPDLLSFDVGKDNEIMAVWKGLSL